MADDKKPTIVRFVGGPMHCYPVPELLRGMLRVWVRMGPTDPETPYSLGIIEDEETGERVVFYGCDDIEDMDELDRLVRTVRFPC